ncbi:MAG: OsmC family protein [Candidatus Omnitrophota bacterium]
MDVKVEIISKRNGKFTVDCFPSGKSFTIDVGKDVSSLEGPTPLEVLLSALGSCVGVYAEKYLAQHSIVFTKIKTIAKAELSEESPTRLVNIRLKIHTDAKLGKDEKAILLKFMQACPVHNTIIHTKEIDIGIA